MKEIKVTIPDDVVVYIQQRDIEYNALKDIIITILTNTDLTIDNERFQDYQKQYITKKAMFELTKQEFSKEYISQYVKNLDDSVEWSLLYSDNLLTIRTTEDNFL